MSERTSSLSRDYDDSNAVPETTLAEESSTSTDPVKRLVPTVPFPGATPRPSSYLLES